MKNFYNLNEFNFLVPFQNQIDYIVNEYKDIDKIKELAKYVYVKNDKDVAVFNTTTSNKED